MYKILKSRSEEGANYVVGKMGKHCFEFEYLNPKSSASVLSWPKAENVSKESQIIDTLPP